MEIKTFRAASLQEALELVRAELGPHAAVLQTRQLRRGLLGRLTGGAQVEIAASASVRVPSRFAPPTSAETAQTTTAAEPTRNRIPRAEEHDYRRKFQNDLKSRLDDHHRSIVEDLSRDGSAPAAHRPPESLLLLMSDLIDAEVPESSAREWIDRLRLGTSPEDLDDPVVLKTRLVRMVEDEIEVSGPIRTTPGRRRLVALIGPTGVGKTTTIAKLAGNFHLRKQCRVGLITVDTYRIAAVEQLKTYAEIIDLPMVVVSSAGEMREAVRRLSHLDLILMDTAGRSPQDEVKIRELRYLLAEAEADEVHLVLSSVSSLENMKKTVRQFADVGVRSLLLTKLDEATGLGSLIPLLRTCRLPLSYVTNGQNVPDDIEPANRRRLARMITGMEPAT